MTIEEIKTIDELKKYLISLIRKDIEAFKTFEGSGLIPTAINRTSQILEKLGVPIYQCKFCDIYYPLDLLYQIMGRRLCSRCREEIKK